MCGKLYIIENVEAEVCKECGERYFHAKVLDEIDDHLTTEHRVKERIDVEVVAM
ncbi:MAG: YgiT-type zinc finger protein [Nitrospirota bacterium]